MDDGRRGFKTTRWSLVLRAGGAPTKDSREALEELCRAYRAPLLTFARRFTADPDRAEDLVQGFLTGFVEKDVAGAADPARGSFRGLLRTSLRNYAYRVRDKERAQKRDPGPVAGFVDANLVASEDPSADRLYDRLWARTLLARAHARFSDEQIQAGKGALLEALRERLVGEDDDDTPALREVAAALGMSGVALRVALHRLRRRFAKLVREEVAETVERPEDVDAELRNLCTAWRDDR